MEQNVLGQGLKLQQGFLGIFTICVITKSKKNYVMNLCFAFYTVFKLEDSFTQKDVNYTLNPYRVQ